MEEQTKWREKDVDDDSSDASDGNKSVRKRKHKEKKHKKDKKHSRKHHRDSVEDIAPANSTVLSISPETPGETSSLTQPVPVLEDTRPKREEWMADSETNFLFPSMLQQDIRRGNQNAKTAAREAQQKETERLYKARELNPEIHGAAKSSPENTAKPSETSMPVMSVGDGGASWLKKAYRRLEEQAADRGCTVEEAAADRFGSLANLKSMIAAAEKREGIVSASDDAHRRRGMDEKRGFYEHRRSGRDSDRNYSPLRREDKSSKSSLTASGSSPRRSGSERRSPNDTRTSRKGEDDGRRRDRSSAKREISRGMERNRERPAREETGANRPRPAFVKPGEELPTSWKSKDKDRAQYVPKSNYTPAEKKAMMEVMEKVDVTPVVTEQAPASEKEEPSLSPAELNQINARILRAELMGDQATVGKLKAKIASAGKVPSNPTQPSSSKPRTESIILSRVHEKGFSYPVQSAPEAPVRGKFPKTATHNVAGEREKYFADDDKYSLSQLVSMEKMQSAADQNALFSRLAGKVVEKIDDDYGMDDAFLKKALQKETLDQMSTRDRDRAIMEHKQIGAALGSCLFCMEGAKFPKHLVIAVGKKCLIMLPPFSPLTEGHCLICPIQHVAAAASLDEDVWEEMQSFRRSLVAMFAKIDRECVFLEMVRDLKRHPHMTWECVPVDKNLDSDPRGCFKSAILSAEGEWTQNVKLVDLSKKDIRHSVPKNFPYFSVDFGLNGGYAHVIEDERQFPAHFGQEIIGDMIGAQPRLWLKNVPINFNDQMKNVNKFAKLWAPFDCTDKNVTTSSG